jgi:hypothetical protein
MLRWQSKMFKIAARKSRGMQRTDAYVKFRGMQRNKDIGRFAKPSILFAHFR